MIYLYDGSFDGLLTVVYYDYYRGKADGIFVQETSYQGSLFDKGTQIIATDITLADRVYQAIGDKLSESALTNVYQAYLSNLVNKEIYILRYLRFSFSVGVKGDDYHTHPSIQPIHRIAAQVGLEKHRMLGLLRFIDTKKFLYAPFTPDHNILPLIADHFTDRLREENFIIHDTHRHLVIIHNANQSWQLQFLNDELTDRLEQEVNPMYVREEGLSSYRTDNPDEILYQKLWRCYFNTIAIKSRQNKRLVNHFIPQRYRCHLIEMLDALDK